MDKLLGKLEEGFDAVYASYEHKQHSAFRNMGSKVNELMTRICWINRRICIFPAILQ